MLCSPSLSSVHLSSFLACSFNLIASLSLALFASSRLSLRCCTSRSKLSCLCFFPFRCASIDPSDTHIAQITPCSFPFGFTVSCLLFLAHRGNYAARSPWMNKRASSTLFTAFSGKDKLAGAPYLHLFNRTHKDSISSYILIFSLFC